MCNTLEVNIELIPIRNDGKKSDVEHYTKSPHIEYNEIFKIGLVKGHYFINDTTTLTSYCQDNFEEVKGIRECNHIWKKKGEYYERDKKTIYYSTSTIQNINE